MRINYRAVAVHAVATVALVASTVGGVVAAAPEAHSVTPSNRVACGGLWMHDHTAADENRCRANGWTITPRYILSADGNKMWSGVSPCSTEDGRNCYWNARLRGNHVGRSFVNLGNLGTFTGLTRINGRDALAPIPRCGPQR